MTGIAGIAAAAKARSFLSAIPRPVWIGLIVVALLGLGSCLHKRAVHKFGEEQYAAGVKAEKDRAEKAAEKQAKKDEKVTAKIKERNREEAVRIARDADTLRLSGPGRARCPAAPEPTDRHEPGSGPTDDAGPQVPEPDRAAVPWAWLVQRAEQCDLNRAEVIAWRDWHKQLSESRADANR